MVKYKIDQKTIIEDFSIEVDHTGNGSIVICQKRPGTDEHDFISIWPESVDKFIDALRRKET